jgi:hypothetical protein
VIGRLWNARARLPARIAHDRFDLSPARPIWQGKSQESKEAWLASHIFGIDHDDPWGRHHGLNGLGSAVPAVSKQPTKQLGCVGVRVCAFAWLDNNFNGRGGFQGRPNLRHGRHARSAVLAAERLGLSELSRI